jgi:uncharacterized delta-60 repeat protein
MVRTLAGIATVAAVLLAPTAPAASRLADRRGGIADAQLRSPSWAAAYAVAIELDGKLVTAGVSSAAGKQAFALARYTRNGSLDSSFGRGGKVRTDVGVDSAVWDVAVQPNGKIVVAGSSPASAKRRAFELARYRRNGVLDASFGRGGKVLTGFGRYSGAARILIQADGKLIAVGWSGNPVHVALIRYTRRGALDASFGRNGKVLTSLPAFDDTNESGAAIQRDGKIVVGFRDLIARYTAHGTLDRTFGRGGKVSIGFPAASLAIQHDGKLVAAGYETVPKYGDNNDFALARFLTNGRSDAGFASKGAVVTDFKPPYDTAAATALGIQTDGKLVAAGYAGNVDGLDIINTHFALARYRPDGSLDTSFGEDGKTTGFGSDSSVEDVAIQRDGKIIVAGYNNSTGRRSAFALARYRRGGNLDARFGHGGKVTTHFSSP